MAVRRVGLSRWFNGKGPHMLRIKSFPSADRSDLCYSHTVTRPNPGEDWEPDCGPDSSCCGSLQLCWVGWNLKSCCWPYKNMVEAMCELCGCWPVVVSLCAVELHCLKTSIPAESVTSTTLTASDTFTNECSLRTLSLLLDIFEMKEEHMPVVC